MSSRVIMMAYTVFFFNDTATTEIYTLSLHDALPICRWTRRPTCRRATRRTSGASRAASWPTPTSWTPGRRRRCRRRRSEEHTSELQSRQYLVCRLLLEKKNKELTILAYTVATYTNIT